ncbi:MAG: dockerin type I domain-containing protein [Planctomycetaceae bacterium]|nr:dockerin type I domain-containing protein [Planctomycetaceae bacterium]
MSHLAAVAASVIAGSAFGTDRLVPQQYPTIQAAVDASVQGDRVLVSPGFYREAVRLTKAVMVEGLSPAHAAQTIVSGAGVVGPAFQTVGGTSYIGDVGVRNLTVTGENVLEFGENAGVFFADLGSQSRAVVEHCIFRENYGGSAYGALYLGHRDCVVRDCLFEHNYTRPGGVGGAIYFWQAGAPGTALIERCVLRDHPQAGQGTIVLAPGYAVTFRDSIVRNSPTLIQNYGTADVLLMQNITACTIGQVLLPGFAGYIDGGGNDWDGPCPDCDANGVIDLEEILFGGADCNANGIVDACDLAADPKLDHNGDGLIDACQCIPDVTGNGFVDGVDLAAVLSSWGSDGEGEFRTDLTGDGTVNGADLATVLSGWGACP